MPRTKENTRKRSDPPANRWRGDRGCSVQVPKLQAPSRRNASVSSASGTQSASHPRPRRSNPDGPGTHVCLWLIRRVLFHAVSHLKKKKKKKMPLKVLGQDRDARAVFSQSRRPRPRPLAPTGGSMALRWVAERSSRAQQHRSRPGAPLKRLRKTYTLHLFFKTSL